jgi:predicted Holliday junction resolvase-like endonuclease
MLEIVLFFIIVILLVIIFFLIKTIFDIKSNFDELRYRKASQSVKYGQLTEQWIPFSEKFPYSPQNFRFIGKPIDGIAFEEDKIIFVEFKTASSSLSDIQRKVRSIVENKKVEWFELKIK